MVQFNIAEAAAKFKLKWQIWTYNYAWSDYVPLFDGWIARCAIGVPIIGYLIIFNDSITSHITFETITDRAADDLYLNSATRLRFIYFGLIFLGLANMTYRFRRPWVHRFGSTVDTFTENTLKSFTVDQYIRLHHIIRNEGHLTPNGKYYDSEWEGFLSLATGIEGRTNKSENQPGDWNAAKSKYENLLRSILSESFFRNSIERRISLTFCVTISILGYLCLALPSIDLFVGVLIGTFN